MKKVKVLFAFVVCISSCNKIKGLVKVNVPMQSADISFTIPAQPSAGTYTLAQFSTSLNVDSLIKAENSSLGINNIKSVKITACAITLQNADTLNHFGVLSTCKAELSTNNNSTLATLAELSSNRDTATSYLNLPVNSSLELKNYFSGTSFYYKISGTTRRPITKDLQAKATIKFDVQVTP
ncbi:MAG TPA: hypothetical protein VF008_18130 [Niastella sp.]